jgi:hypothetical protein
MISRLQPKLGWLAGALLSAASLTAASSAPAGQPPAGQAQAGSPNKAADQSDRISQRIDALLRRRLNPEGLPQLLPNPFFVASANVASLRAGGSDPEAPSDGSVDTSAAAPPVQPAAGPPPGTSAAEILARCVAELKIGGVIEQRGELQIVVNGVPRKEGDFVVVGLDKSTVRLEVLHILPRGIVVRLGDAELTVRF